jgi:hypothetical protein
MNKNTCGKFGNDHCKPNSYFPCLPIPLLSFPTLFLRTCRAKMLGQILMFDGSKYVVWHKKVPFV